MEGQLGMHLFGRLVERGVVPRSVYRGVEELLRRYREGRMEREQMVLESVAAFVACLAGVDVGIVEAHAAEVWREQSGALMAYVPEFVGLLRDRGFTCFVVSASPDVIVRHVAETLELDGYRGSRYAMGDGRFTGTVELMPGARGEKLTALRELVREDAVDWGASLAIGDTGGDACLLERVGFPVAFEPDRTLRPLAAARGWLTVDRATVVDAVRRRLDGAR